MRQRLSGIWVIICVAFFATACAPVQFVSQYDQVTDEGVTALQKKVAMHFESLIGQESPACTFANYEAFYVDVLTDMEVLMTRAELINANSDGRNEITVEQLDNTNESLEELRDLHSAVGDACISGETLIDLRDIFASNFRVILAFEFAKKRELYSVEGGDGN